MELLKHIFTARDNATFSLSKLIGTFGTFAMVYNFVKIGSVDFQGFGIGISTLVAALAAKYYVEDKKE